MSLLVAKETFHFHSVSGADETIVKGTLADESSVIVRQFSHMFGPAQPVELDESAPAYARAS
jgi:hypothetical protein